MCLGSELTTGIQWLLCDVILRSAPLLALVALHEATRAFCFEKPRDTRGEQPRVRSQTWSDEHVPPKVKHLPCTDRNQQPGLDQAPPLYSFVGLFGSCTEKSRQRTQTQSVSIERILTVAVQPFADDDVFLLVFYGFESGREGTYFFFDGSHVSCQESVRSENAGCNLTCSIPSSSTYSTPCTLKDTVFPATVDISFEKQ
jgi:hypothetical protein